MSWDGAKIKERADELNKSLVELARMIGVSRQTIDAWIKGQVPRGQHLIKLCREMGTAPAYFFTAENESLVTVPQHRTIRKKPVTDEMQAATKEVAEQYVNLFRSAPDSSIVRVVRAAKRDNENAKKIAVQLRSLSDVGNGRPMDFEHAFKMLTELGIYTVFRPFPEAISNKIYAFYSKICGQRVIFVNTDTNIIDLTFQLIHESVHAIRDEEPDKFDEKEEEAFCDSVANYVQFPDDYVVTVAQAVKGCVPGVIINKLKVFSKQNRHSLFGIVARLEEVGVNLKRMGVSSSSLAGADTNLKKTVHSVSSVLFSSGDARDYVERLRILSPAFTRLVAEQLSDASLRKLGEWLGLDNTVDTRTVLSELKRIGSRS